MKNLKKIGAFVASASLALAIFIAPAHTFAAQVYNFASTTEESQAVQSALVAQGYVIILGALAALLPLALVVLGVGYVWRKFKKFSGMRRGI